MALQATFVADFTQFETALKSATTKLDSEFKTSTASVQKSLQRMSDSFSGQKIITEAQKIVVSYNAIGGATALTAKEQERVNAKVTEAIAKYQVLGRAVPPELQKVANETAKIVAPVEQATQKTSLLGKAFSAIGPQMLAAFSVGAVTAFIAKTIDWADSIQDLAERTGFSTTTIQRLSAVANTSGTSVEAMTKSIGFMARTLGDKSSGTIKALTELGLSYDALAAMAPEQQFTAVAQALVKVEDTNRRAALGADLLGKTFTEIQPALKRVAAGLEDLPVASEKAIKAAADVKDAWEEMKRAFLVVAAEVIGAIKTLGDWWDKTVGKLRQPIAKAGQSLGEWLGLTELGVTLDKPTVAVSRWTEEVKRNGKEMGYTQAQTDAMNTALTRIHPTLQATEGAQKKAADAAKALAEALGREREALDKLTGADGLDLAVKRLGQIEQLGGISVLTPAATVESMRIMAEAMGYLDRIGVGADETREKITAMWASLQSGVPGLTTATPVFPGFQHGAIPATGMPGMEGGADIMDWLAGVPGMGALGAQPVGKSFLSGFGQVMQGLPQIIIGALQGGGDIAGSIGGFIGSGIGAGLSAAFLPATMIPIVGPIIAAAGALLGPLFSKLFGPSEQEKAAKLRTELIAQAGGLAKIQEMADYAGVSMARFFSAKTQNNVKKELLAIQAAFDAVSARVKALITDLAVLSDTGELLDPDLMRRLLADKDKPEVRAALGQFVSDSTLRAVEGLNTLMSSPYLGGGALQGVQESIIGLFGALTSQGYSAAEALKMLEPAMAGVYTQIGQGLPSYKALIAAQREFEAATDPEAKAIAQTALTAAQTAYNTELAKMPIEGFRELAALAGLASDAVAGPAIQAVSGLKDTLVGLHNAGLLTEGMFAGLAGTVVDTYGTIISRGGTANQALRLMQPSLQTIWQLMKDFGYEVDEATKGIIAQAESEGLIGEKFRPAADRMATAIGALIAKIGELIDKLTKDLPAGAAAGADGVVWEVGRRQPTMTIGVRYETVGGLPDVPDTIGVTGIQAFARGAIVRRPTVALIGEAGPEAVVPLAQSRMPPVVVHVDAKGAYLGDYGSQRSFAAAVESAVSNVLRGNLRLAGA